MFSHKLQVGLAFAALVTVVAGCTSLGKALAGHPVPGYGVDEEVARTMGCDLADIKTRGDRYRKESYDSGGPGYVVPSVGDTGCDVLAKLGRPDDTETITTEFGSALNFWHQTGTSTQGNVRRHLVTLGEDSSGSGTVVTSVVW